VDPADDKVIPVHETADPQHSGEAFDEGPLGQSSKYPMSYTPSLLHPMNREMARARAGVGGAEGLRGEDLWTGYDFSWLDGHGKPVVAGLRLRVPCQSAAIVESKSLKLYLGSFAQSHFVDSAEVRQRLIQDLSRAFGGSVMVELVALSDFAANTEVHMAEQCLDALQVAVEVYERDPRLLVVGDAEHEVRERVFTHLFRSLCPVTAQPDLASVYIDYSGQAIDHAGLLRYLVSYRNHQAFHETTIEQIYVDLFTTFNPVELSVHGLFQRRGGLDINPFRSNHSSAAPGWRTVRQ